QSAFPGWRWEQSARRPWPQRGSQELAAIPVVASISPLTDRGSQLSYVTQGRARTFPRCQPGYLLLDLPAWHSMLCCRGGSDLMGRVRLLGPTLKAEGTGHIRTRRIRLAIGKQAGQPRLSLNTQRRGPYAQSRAIRRLN